VIPGFEDGPQFFHGESRFRLAPGKQTLQSLEQVGHKLGLSQVSVALPWCFSMHVVPVKPGGDMVNEGPFRSIRDQFAGGLPPALAPPAYRQSQVRACQPPQISRGSAYMAAATPQSRQGPPLPGQR
jgi:hypothetical protein